MLSQESFTSIWWRSFQVETWKLTTNFTNKLLKLLNSIKTDFLFAGLHLNRIIQKTKCQKKAHFMDNALNTSGLTHLNVDTWLLFAPTIKFCGYAPV